MAWALATFRKQPSHPASQPATAPYMPSALSLSPLWSKIERKITKQIRRCGLLLWRYVGIDFIPIRQDWTFLEQQHRKSSQSSISKLFKKLAPPPGPLSQAAPSFLLAEKQLQPDTMWMAFLILLCMFSSCLGSRRRIVRSSMLRLPLYTLQSERAEV